MSLSSTAVEEQLSLTSELLVQRAQVNRSELARPAILQLNKLRAVSDEEREIALITQKSKELISNALQEEVERINHDTCEAGEENSFFVCDLGKVERLLKIWRQNLPRVQPFYAVKCNPNPEVLKLLASMGVNFDCASKGEIDLILSLGVDPSRIIYAHPCKTSSFLRHAKKENVQLTTFDNADELYKLKKFHPGCRLLLRIITDDETAQCRLSTKYGAPLSSVPNLLNLAKELGLDIAGVSFHVGSGANDNSSLVKAVRDASDVFELGQKLGFNMKMLDVGGGFSYESLGSASEVLRLALDEYFPVSTNVEIIAEPGRYFVANAFTLATHVIAKRGGVFDTNTNDQQQSMVYINDGVYGNMNCILFDHQHPEAHVLTHRGQFLYGERNQVNQERYNVSIWGPTCDGLDCISNNATLSHNVQVGDWLYFPDLGAYTSAAASPFNGFEAQARTIYVNSERG
jgi:ornithine decarboxylase